LGQLLSYGILIRSEAAKMLLTGMSGIGTRSYKNLGFLSSSYSLSVLYYSTTTFFFAFAPVSYPPKVGD
jgi:hypothetical protein